MDKTQQDISKGTKKSPQIEENEDLTLELKLEENLIKKKGFLLTLQKDGNKNPQELLEDEISKLKDKYRLILEDYLISQHDVRTEQFRQIEMISIHLIEIKEKRLKYITYVDTLPEEKKTIEGKITDLQQSIFDLLQEIGKAKENIVKTSLQNIDEELKKVLKISKEIEVEQNDNFKKDYDTYQDVNKTRIDFIKEVLAKFQNQYDEITSRINTLTKDGVTAQTAKFFLVLGSIASLVSGWWFSLWTGPQPKSGASENISGNSSVRFFFIDNIAKYFSEFGVINACLYLIAYLLAVGLLSYLCHLLLIKFGMIPDRKKVKKAKKTGQEGVENFEFDINEQDNLLKTSLVANSWWGLWLKITPFIFAVIPILAVLSKQVAVEANQKNLLNIKEQVVQDQTSVTNFQNLFDSLVNQFIGTSIAIIFAVFSILYLSRVVETNYYSNEKRNKTVYLGFFLFLLMAASMILYHYSFPLIDDIRRVAIFGFILSTVATGFSLAYGYIFSGMQENADMLLYNINFFSILINRLSKPYQVNYSTNTWMQSRILKLQQKMVDIVEARHDMATDISAGIDQEETKEIHVVVSDTESGKAEKNLEVKDNPSIWDSIRNFFSKNLFGQREDEEKGGIQHHITRIELKYFSEKTEKIAEYNSKIKELKKQKQNIDTENENYYLNKGITKSLNSQVESVENQINAIRKQIVEEERNGILEKIKIGERLEKEKTLLKEGFFTGIWFEQSNNSQFTLPS